MTKNNLDLKQMEEKWRKYWEKEQIYKFNPNTKKKIYSIDTPPPYVSGRMHIGHAFSYSQQDFIVRFRRMFHGDVFYPFGTDDNGLPTERFVEKINKVKSKDMSRAEFIDLCLKTLKKVTPACIEDFKVLGISADYSIYYSTIDEHSRKISQRSFIELFNDKKIYKKHFPTLWCPECQTAIAQAELEDKEKTTNLSYIKGKMDDGSFIIYATTRPELHPGCVGISLDEKGDYVKAKRENEVWIISKDAYDQMKDEFKLKLIEKFKGKNLVGKKVGIKFSEQPVFVSHDVSAKTEYGTGVVYYCSYGGLDCVQWLTRHKEAKAISVMDESGTYTKGPAKGLRSEEAREKILELLEKEGLLIKNEKMDHVINTHDKCGTPIEFIGTEQWFIKILDKKEKLIKQGKKVNWLPKFMYKRYENWVKGLDWDWSISRDRHFGIPIPVWYCKKCDEIILPEEKELPVDPLQIKKECPKCKQQAKGETRVLDTWATSSLTPQLAIELMPKKIQKKLYPMSLRPQAHDIIRTWAFYTIVKSLYHENKIPWKNIIVSGYVTLGGKKMSKSKGNVIEPQQVIKEYSADALRSWAASSKLGEDLPYQEKDVVTGKKTITKLLNASRFVFMNLKNYKPKKIVLMETDKLFLSKLNKSIKNCTDTFEKYEYSKAKFEVDNFFWKMFCDNYLEIVKHRVYNGNKSEKESAFYTLYYSLLTILKLMAPIMPFITEDIYQTYFRKNEREKSIHVSEWPKEFKVKAKEEVLDLMIKTISKIRQEKTKAQKPMNAKIELTLEKKDKAKLKGVTEDLKSVSGTTLIKEGKFKVEFV